MTEEIKNRAFRLMLGRQIQFGIAPDEDAVHGDLQEEAEGIQVVHAGKGEPLLPFVDRLRRVESEVTLHVPDCQSLRLPQSDDLPSGRFKVNRRETLHSASLHALCSVVRLQCGEGDCTKDPGEMQGFFRGNFVNPQGAGRG